MQKLPHMSPSPCRCCRPLHLQRSVIGVLLEQQRTNSPFGGGHVGKNVRPLRVVELRFLQVHKWGEPGSILPVRHNDNTVWPLVDDLLQDPGQLAPRRVDPQESLPHPPDGEGIFMFSARSPMSTALGITTICERVDGWNATAKPLHNFTVDVRTHAIPLTSEVSLLLAPFLSPYEG